jgi:hypothetical protein
MFDLTGFEPLTEPPIAVLPTPSAEVARSAKELGAEYQVSDRTIQAWYGIILKAYPWLPETTFKIGNSNRTRYTPEFQRLVKLFRQSGLSAEDWINQIHQDHPEQSQQKVEKAESQTKTAFSTYSGFGLEPEAVVPEVVDASGAGGSLIQVAQTFQAQPLIHLRIQTLNINFPESNTARLEQDTSRLQTQTVEALGLLQQAIAADFTTKLSTILAQNTHAVAAIQNGAVIQAAESLGLAAPAVAPLESP